MALRSHLPNRAICCWGRAGRSRAACVPQGFRPARLVTSRTGPRTRTRSPRQGSPPPRGRAASPSCSPGTWDASRRWTPWSRRPAFFDTSQTSAGSLQEMEPCVGGRRCGAFSRCSGALRVPRPASARRDAGSLPASRRSPRQPEARRRNGPDRTEQGPGLHGCRVPYLASLDGEGARIVEEAGAGFASKAGDAEGLAGNVLRMKALPAQTRAVMGDTWQGLLPPRIQSYDRARIGSRPRWLGSRGPARESPWHPRQMRILTLIDCYVPGFKHGGPIRTIANLVAQMPREFEFWILTSDRDRGDRAPYEGVPLDSWTERGHARVYYARHTARVSLLRTVIRDARPDVVYANSFFSPTTTSALLARRLGLVPRIPFIIAPRGEFAPSALGLKKWKKAPTSPWRSGSAC